MDVQQPKEEQAQPEVSAGNLYDELLFLRGLAIEAGKRGEETEALAHWQRLEAVCLRRLGCCARGASLISALALGALGVPMLHSVLAAVLGAGAAWSAAGRLARHYGAGRFRTCLQEARRQILRHGGRPRLTGD